MHVTLSLFASARDNRAVRETTSFDEFLTDFYEPTISELEPSEANLTALKMSSPAFSPAIFKDDRRKKANVETAQVLVYDIDENVDPRELSARLRRRDICYALHTTASGEGVHVLVPLARPVDYATYLRYWDEGAKIFHGIELDRSKRGPESLFFAPRVFAAKRNEYYVDSVTDAPHFGASGFRPLVTDKYAEELRTTNEKHTTLNRIAFVFGLTGVELADTRARLLAALRDNPSEVRDWEAAERTLEKAWTDGRAQKDADDARPKIVPREAKSAAKKLLKEVCAAIGKGEALGTCAYRVGQFVPHVFTKDDVLDTLREAWERAKTHDTRSLSDAVSELVEGLEGGMRAPRGLIEEWQVGLALTPDGLGFHAGENNVHVVLEKHPQLTGVLAYDVRDGAPCYLAAPPWAANGTYPCRIKDADRQRCARWLREQLGVPQISVKTALLGLVDVANENVHDPLLEYFRSLPITEHTNVLEGVLIELFGAEDTAYVRAVTKRWLIGVVSRQFVPGSKVDNMLILVGDQGAGKSTFFREIFPESLQGSCYTDTLNMLRLDKDQIVKLSRYAVVEVGELAAMRKADIETVKLTISQQCGDERAAYAMLHAQYPRRAAWAGSTNRDDFLRDPTGNRRFWPLKITKKLELETLRTLRDELWSQAVSAYLRGERWTLTAAEEACAVEARTEYEEDDVLLEEIRAILADWPADSKFTELADRTLPWQLEAGRIVRARVGQLMSRIGIEKKDRNSERRVADNLRRLGWKPKLEKHEGTPYRVWLK